jgi:hypothetical protein
VPIRSKARFALLLFCAWPFLHGWTPPEDSCLFRRVKRHSYAETLLQEYLKRDFQGQFTSWSDWHASALLCPGHEPGWDSSTIVASYSIGVPRQSRETYSVPVTYQKLGAAWSDGGFEEGVERETVAFVLMRTPFGWRIVEPQQNPHQSPKALLTQGCHRSA